jgi:hypothetical protein
MTAVCEMASTPKDGNTHADVEKVSGREEHVASDRAKDGNQHDERNNEADVVQAYAVGKARRGADGRECSHRRGLLGKRGEERMRRPMRAAWMHEGSPPRDLCGIELGRDAAIGYYQHSI